MNTNNDIRLMEHAIRIADKNSGLVSPRPLVGAVIVNNGKIVGEGVTEPRPGNHAEVNAINKAGVNTRGGTLYCTLEPHSFQSISPPCTEAIIKSGIKRVVCPIKDPNPLINGNGFKQLKSAKVEVETKISESILSQCKKMIFAYQHFINHRRPFITLKNAMSLDGKIATYNGDSKWITNKISRDKVHKLRYNSDGIITGIGTILQDNPRLTSRNSNDKYFGRPRYRIVLDSFGKIPGNSKIFQEPGKIIIASAIKLNNLPHEVENLVIPDENNNVSIKQLIQELSNLGLHNLLLESGGKLNTNFLKLKLVDQLKIFVGNIIVGGQESLSVFSGEGSKLIKDSFTTEIISIEQLENNFLVTSLIKYLDPS